MTTLTDEEKISQVIQSFRCLNQAFHKQFWHNADQLGVTVVQLHILKVLADEPGTGLNDLAHKVNASKSTVSETVERLVQAELVKRERSTHDRRAIVLSLTPKGLEQKKTAYRTYLQRLGNISDFSTEEVETLLSLHSRLLQKITTQGDETT
ncbi:transcriptional regulator [Terribacillus saccharophilus]|jgi:MarR family transcriptional regulator, organic hydroperoxide resistance regulator|nr:hypothetical protein GZ22_11255 [Terribacillus goriensis]PAD33648.1 transcriptional regulator [Terribacillus saccharophilus]PAD94471.1 transcriptional regulator [Terribacillus saccharophilus]PAD98154.1 transcriptional regulator [Terribacillus saccharophilus]PAE06264.1 transcriptional regulator [Terribacillus saccharophilus]